MRAQLSEQPLGDALVHEQPRPRAAHLPLVEPDRVDHALDHAVQVGVLEHDERALPAELERESLPGARRPAPDGPPDLGRAGERDLVDVGMLDDQLAGAAVTRHHVQHAGRDARLLRDLGE